MVTELPKDNFISNVTHIRMMCAADMRAVIGNALARISDPPTRRALNIFIDELQRTEARLLTQRNSERAIDFSAPLFSPGNAPAQPKKSPPPPPPKPRPPETTTTPPTKE